MRKVINKRVEIPVIILAQSTIGVRTGIQSHISSLKRPTREDHLLIVQTNPGEGREGDVNKTDGGHIFFVHNFTVIISDSPNSLESQSP